MTIDEKLRLLHNLGMKARDLLGKEGNEPRTMYRFLPDGTALVLFYSSCFSFIPNNSNQIAIGLHELDDYIEKARKEVALYETVHGSVGSVSTSFKSKAYVIPFVFCLQGIKRIYKLHLCKDHRKDRCLYKPKCQCYLTWEEFGKEG